MKFPVWKGYLTQGFKTTHPANDYGWIRLNLTKPPIYSWADGVVFRSFFDNTSGNGVEIRHRNISKYHDYITRYYHLNSRALQVGATVKSGQVVGIGGTTGTISTGEHLHFEIWIVPKNYVFSAGDRSKYAIDPRLAAFIIANQPFTGEGVQTMTYDYSNNPIAKPKFSNVRMRSTPAILPNNILPEFVPKDGIPFIAFTKELINGHQWAECVYNGDRVYIAYSLLNVDKQIQIVEVEKVKPLDITCVQDGVEIKLQVNEILK